MEARISAETGHLVARQSIPRDSANDMVKKILAEYEAGIPTAPEGKRFDECYNLETVRPTREYLDLYDRCKEKLRGIGLDYSLL
jgi:methylamine--corrinoid protein Co-methyltransferase